MMFKKGSFEIGGDVYPVAIKASPNLVVICFKQVHVKRGIGLSMNVCFTADSLASGIRRLNQLPCYLTGH